MFSLCTLESWPANPQTTSGHISCFLVHVHEIVRYIRLYSIDILAPLPQAFHFRRHSQVFLTFGLDHDNPAVRLLDEEVWVLV